MGQSESTPESANTSECTGFVEVHTTTHTPTHTTAHTTTTGVTTAHTTTAGVTSAAGVGTTHSARMGTGSDDGDGTGGTGATTTAGTGTGTTTGTVGSGSAIGTAATGTTATTATTGTTTTTTGTAGTDTATTVTAGSATTTTGTAGTGTAGTAGTAGVGRLSVVSGQCIREHDSSKLSFTFYRQKLSKDDIMAALHGEFVHLGAQFFRDISKPPYISVVVNMRDPTRMEEEKLKEDFFVFGKVPNDMVFTVVWAITDGTHQSKTVRLSLDSPLGEERFHLKQVSTHTVSLDCESSPDCKDISWKLNSSALIVGTPSEQSDDIVWQRDEMTERCMKCDYKFTIFNRRHHCRSCGYIFCNSCSTHRNDANQRICDRCRPWKPD